jgi:hypothetical protein
MLTDTAQKSIYHHKCVTKVPVDALNPLIIEVDSA